MLTTVTTTAPITTQETTTRVTVTDRTTQSTPSTTTALTTTEKTTTFPTITTNETLLNNETNEAFVGDFDDQISQVSNLTESLQNQIVINFNPILSNTIENGNVTEAVVRGNGKDFDHEELENFIRQKAIELVKIKR